MSKNLTPHALDGFHLSRLTIMPNSGADVEIRISDSVCYVLRVESRGGHASVSWDGLAVFDNGRVEGSREP
jgi:hypothetical protein